ncbi:hypothetical protein QAD02_022850 [Eretmocerus hayati]|uniref:Uncharacterized protein n=1 Tax=Eretmocerus hayati TaxID=131215 RepID=A0ACC2PWA7_9HYME|nr:hypothetical protein QAD02_022850 [Eretmocerus hayati]
MQQILNGANVRAHTIARILVLHRAKENLTHAKYLSAEIRRATVMANGHFPLRVKRLLTMYLPIRAWSKKMLHLSKNQNATKQSEKILETKDSSEVNIERWKMAEWELSAGDLRG